LSKCPFVSSFFPAPGGYRFALILPEGVMALLMSQSA